MNNSYQLYFMNFYTHCVFDLGHNGCLIKILIECEKYNLSLLTCSWLLLGEWSVHMNVQNS